MSTGVVGNHFGARCTHGFLLVLRGTPVTAVCGHCDEVVYPDLLVLRNHDFHCESGVCVWYSRDLEMEAHRCQMPGASVDVSELLDLTAPVSA